MKAIGYVRVSTDEQVRNGVSLDSQRDKIRAWAGLHDHELLEILDDEGRSGFSRDKRPGVNRAVELAVETGGILVVYALDRLSRNVVDHLLIAQEINDAGAQLVSITENIDTTTSHGRLYFTISAALAQLYRDQVAERTRVALERKSAKGEALGNTPYGYRASNLGHAKRKRNGNDDGEVSMLEPDPEEQETLAMMLSAHNDSSSYAQVARLLNAAGRRNRAGHKWERGAVRRIILQNQPKPAE